VALGAGFTGLIEAFNATGAVYDGSVAGRFGNRKPPSSANATQSPILHYEVAKKEMLFEGGNFRDGRPTGEKLGNPAADQA
jgi:cytochrome c peroxidase